MRKFCQWLLSLVFLFHAGLAQPIQGSSFCDTQHWRDSVTTHLFRSGDGYMSKQWQLYCDSILKICPDYAYIWEMKAMPHIKGGFQDFASLNKAVSINPVKQIPYRAFMKCIFAKDYYGALHDLDSAEILVKGGGIMDHSFSFYKGLCFLGTEQNDSALVYFKKDITEQSKRMGAGNEHYNSLFYMGLSYLLTNDFANAAHYLSASIKSYSHFPEPNFYLGVLYAKTNRKEMAIACFAKAKEYLSDGSNMNEDNNFYVDYPFQIGISDISDAQKGVDQR